MRAKARDFLEGEVEFFLPSGTWAGNAEDWKDGWLDTGNAMDRIHYANQGDFATEG